jgi:GNAT superfamily N-acetyltransferase
MPTAVRIALVQGRSAQRSFLALSERLYKNEPAWVPPLLLDLKELLNPDKHPFHKHADVEYFLALRGENVVGRIAAVVNHQYVSFHNERIGFFGFFESIDDPAVASALLTAAEQWVAERGMKQIRGPMNFSTNEICGLLVDGFELPPMLMMPYNLAYYSTLIERAGYMKAKDLFAYLFDIREDATPPARLVRGVERLQQAQQVTIRPIHMGRFETEIKQLFRIYQESWKNNWGFVPLTEAELEHFVKQVRWIANPKLCLIAEMEEEMVGFALALPDYNQILQRIDGRLLPFGWLKLLWHKRSINATRILLLGLKPGVRLRGLDAMLYLRFWEEAPKNGYPYVECSWILEDNWPMIRGLERMGAERYKTYRVYEKVL